VNISGTNQAIDKRKTALSTIISSTVDEESWQWHKTRLAYFQQLVLQLHSACADVIKDVLSLILRKAQCATCNQKQAITIYDRRGMWLDTAMAAGHLEMPFYRRQSLAITIDIHWRLREL